MADDGGDADDQYARMDDQGQKVKPVRRKKAGCCECICGYLSKVFIWLYPKHTKLAFTKEGEYLRRYVLISLILHLIFFAVSLAFIGFEPMMANLGLAILQYSNYVTLR